MTCYVQAVLYNGKEEQCEEAGKFGSNVEILSMQEEREIILTIEAKITLPKRHYERRKISHNAGKDSEEKIEV